MIDGSDLVECMRAATLHFSETGPCAKTSLGKRLGLERCHPSGSVVARIDRFPLSPLDHARGAICLFRAAFISAVALFVTKWPSCLAAPGLRKDPWSDQVTSPRNWMLENRHYH